MDLLSIQPTKVSRDLKGKYVLIYGLPKSGKTSLAVHWPKSLLLAFERGYNDLAGIKAVDITSWVVMKQVLRELRKKEVQAAYDSIIIDTTSIAWDKCVDYICQQNGVTDLSEIAWGKGQKSCSKEFEKVFREISMLGYGIVFLAHADERIPFGKDESAMQIVPQLDKRPYRIVNGMVDIIAAIDVEGEGSEAKRFLQLRETPKLFAGSRFQYMPDRIPLDYQIFVNALGEAIEKKGSDGKDLITDEIQLPSTVEKRPFAETMEDAKDIWTKIVEKNDSENTELKIMEIIKDNFGEPVQLSKVPESQQDLLEMTILDLRDFYKTM